MSRTFYFPDKAMQSNHDHVMHLFTSGEWADLKVTCRGRKWNVHRNIVCPRSSFFQKACARESKEATTRTVDFPIDEPEVIEKMLKYLYTLQLDLTSDRPPNLHQNTLRLTTAARIYASGEKYGIPSLKTSALDNFKRAFGHEQRFGWEDDQHIEIDGPEDTAALNETLELVFTSTPEHDQDLRTFCAQFMQCRKLGDTLASSLIFRPLIESNASFAAACFEVMMPLSIRHDTSGPVRELMKQTWLRHFHEDCPRCRDGRKKIAKGGTAGLDGYSFG